MFQIIARQVECHGSDHQVRHHSLHLQVQKAQVFTNYVFCTAADRSPRFPRIPSRCTGSLAMQNSLPARSLDRGQQSNDSEDSGLGADCQRLQVRSIQLPVLHLSPEAIDFSKIEADLTELKTFLYKAQSCTSRTDTRDGSLTVKRCNVLVFP